MVLAVDDKSDSSAVISRALRTRSDLRTLVAYSGAEVISLLQAVAIDVIVVGHPLQEASAIELLDRAAYLGRRPASDSAATRFGKNPASRANATRTRAVDPNIP